MAGEDNDILERLRNSRPPAPERLHWGEDGGATEEAMAYDRIVRECPDPPAGKECSQNEALRHLRTRCETALWLARLDGLRAWISEAARGRPVESDLSELRSLGERKSWAGSAIHRRTRTRTGSSPRGFDTGASDRKPGSAPLPTARGRTRRLAGSRGGGRCLPAGRHRAGRARPGGNRGPSMARCLGSLSTSSRPRHRSSAPRPRRSVVRRRTARRARGASRLCGARARSLEGPVGPRRGALRPTEDVLRSETRDARGSSESLARRAVARRPGRSTSRMRRAEEARPSTRADGSPGAHR